MDTFGKSETETIARNVVIISQKTGDQWQPFTFEEYVARCTHAGACNEQGFLNVLAENGFLHLEDGKYSVTDTFIGRLAEYIKQPA